MATKQTKKTSEAEVEYYIESQKGLVNVDDMDLRHCRNFIKALIRKDQAPKGVMKEVEYVNVDVDELDTKDPSGPVDTNAAILKALEGLAGRLEALEASKPATRRKAS